MFTQRSEDHVLKQDTMPWHSTMSAPGRHGHDTYRIVEWQIRWLLAEKQGWDVCNNEIYLTICWSEKIDPWT